jgi:dTMP kinase
VGRVATGGVMPDLTVVLDMPAEEAARRLRGELDRMERRGKDFHARVRQGFLDEAAGNPGRLHVVDATRPIDQVQAEIRALIQNRTRCALPEDR